MTLILQIRSLIYTLLLLCSSVDKKEYKYDAHMPSVGGDPLYTEH